MNLSLIGALFLVSGTVAWTVSTRAFVAVLSVSAAFVTTAAVSFGESSLPPFYLLAVLATVSAGVDLARGRSVGHPALPVLGLFLAWSLLITAVGPTVFSGVPTLYPRGGIDTQILAPTPLAYSAPMLAQSVYLILAAGVALYLSQRTTLSSTILAPAFLVGNAASLLRLVPGIAEPLDQLVRNYESAGYNPHETRHFGIFAEPSYLSVFALAALAYAIFRYRHASRAGEKFVVLAIAVMAAVNLFLSASGTAAAAILLLISAVIVINAWGFLFRGRRLHPLSLLVPVGVVLFVAIPNRLAESLWGIVEGKLDSDSFIARTASDAFSLNLVLNTFGAGVGLGANRPSSFATLLLSTVGLLGFALFALFAWRAMRPIGRGSAWSPVVASLVALIVAKTLSESALSTPVMWVAFGALLFAGKPVSDTSDRQLREHDLPELKAR